MRNIHSESLMCFADINNIIKKIAQKFTQVLPGICFMSTLAVPSLILLPLWHNQGRLDHHLLLNKNISFKCI